jgi:hypothetical protein
MHVISPLLLVATAVTFALGIQTFWYLLPLIAALLIVKKTRLFIISYLTSNIALIMGLFQHFFGKKEKAWSKIEEMRAV